MLQSTSPLQALLGRPRDSKSRFDLVFQEVFFFFTIWCGQCRFWKLRCDIRKRWRFLTPTMFNATRCFLLFSLLQFWHMVDRNFLSAEQLNLETWILIYHLRAVRFCLSLWSPLYFAFLVVKNWKRNNNPTCQSCLQHVGVLCKHINNKDL